MSNVTKIEMNNKINKIDNIFIITNDPLFIKQHLLSILDKLESKYKITILTNCKSVFIKNIKYNCIHIPIKRKPSPIFDLISFIRLIFLIRANHPDVVISFTPKAALLNALSSFVFKNKKMHYFTGQVWADMKGYKKYFYKLLDLFVIKMMNETLCDSKSQSDFLFKNLNLNQSERPKVLLSGSISGVNLERFKYDLNIRNSMRKELNISQSRFVILFVGRLNYSKGIYTLLKSFKDYLTFFEDDMLLLVGPVEETEILKTLKASKNVSHIDYVEDTSKYYQLSDLFILPSFREGFGSVLIEAGSTSLPSIVSEIPGTIDAVEVGKTALTFKVKSEASLLKSMLYLRNNKKFRENMGKAARKRVERNFSEIDLSQAFLNFINELK